MRFHPVIAMVFGLAVSLSAEATVVAAAGCGAWADFYVSPGGARCAQLYVEHNTAVITEHGWTDTERFAVASSAYAIHADYGDLRGRVSANASLRFSPSEPGGYVLAYAWVDLRYIDQVSVTSPTLAHGTPVSLLFRGSVEVDASESIYNYADVRFALGSQSGGHLESYCYGDIAPGCSDRSWFGYTSFSRAVRT
ncbi:hypothetical protein [Uliginosibacterium sp. H1]|uniref:hypothetical protein n=1 Tax=Uliginosibacterium sp. H1 TaxID=3114757 RepID=UPI002E19818B|nr:hypothetical protein [Uliginosibacterium sp. H1]